MREVIMSDAKVKDEVEVVIIDEIGILTTSIMEKEKAQAEDNIEAIHDQGMTNPKYNAIIVKSLGIMLQNRELQVPELMIE